MSIVRLLLLKKKCKWNALYTVYTNNDKFATIRAE